MVTGYIPPVWYDLLHPLAWTLASTTSPVALLACHPQTGTNVNEVSLTRCGY